MVIFHGDAFSEESMGELIDAAKTVKRQYRSKPGRKAADLGKLL
jgi:hypothetical protein